MSRLHQYLKNAALSLLAPALLAACSSGDGNAPPASLVLTIEAPARVSTPIVERVATATVEPSASATPEPSTPTPEATRPPATATNAPPAATSTSAPQPAATSAPAAPVATATPGAQAPSPSGSVTFKPAQLVQGGTTVVYLNEAAAIATARFGGRQYPMLQDGARWWAIIGVGAIASVGDAPVTISYTPAGQTAERTASASVSIVDRDFPVERIDLDPSATALLAPDIITAELNQRAAIYGGYTPQRLWSGAFVRPSSAAIGDIYGVGRSYNGGPVTDYHRGVDFVAGQGDPLRAAAGGRVVFAGEMKVRGNAVIIDHGAGVFTSYGHLSRIDVAQGAMVAAGQQVGLCGSTGLVTGPHLHWEVIVRGIEVDGELWLRGTDMGP